MPGPVPKRSEDRVRRNKPDVEVTRIPTTPQAKPPAENRAWHIAAKRWYRSLRHSGQAVFYEPSDWAYAQLAADLLTEELGSNKPRASMISEVLSMMDNLLTSEGARRRVRIELVRAGQDEAPAAEVVSLNPAEIYG